MCEHIKVYESSILCSFPPQRRWICRECGEEGTEIAGAPFTFADEYTRVKESFKKD